MKNELNIFDFEVKSKLKQQEAFNSTTLESEILPISTKTDKKLLNKSMCEFSPFVLNQRVKVITPDKNSIVSEDYYYIIEFAEMKGVISKINTGKELSYTVMFDNGREGIFYHNDLTLIFDT